MTAIWRACWQHQWQQCVSWSRSIEKAPTSPATDSRRHSAVVALCDLPPPNRALVQSYPRQAGHRCGRTATRRKVRAPKSSWTGIWLRNRHRTTRWISVSNGDRSKRRFELVRSLESRVRPFLLRLHSLATQGFTAVYLINFLLCLCMSCHNV